MVRDYPSGNHAANGNIEEVVMDKGYHSGAVMVELAEREIRSYVPEPERGQRKWSGKAAEQRCVYANRRRVRAERSKRLQKLRGELCERSFAHCYETGANAAHVRARPGQRDQAGVGAGSGVQHRAAAAQVERMGQTKARPGAQERRPCAALRRNRGSKPVPSASEMGDRLLRASLPRNHDSARLRCRFPVEWFLPRAARQCRPGV